MLTSYEQGLISGALYAAHPWENSPIQEYDPSTTQAEKDYCLFSCPYMDNCAACDRCDGKGNLRRKNGRPKKNVDATEVIVLRETLTIAQICHHLGVGKMTIYRALESQKN